MPRYDDIDPMDIDPDTGRPYAGFSSPALDTSFHDHEMAGEIDTRIADEFAEWARERQARMTPAQLAAAQRFARLMMDGHE